MARHDQAQKEEMAPSLEENRSGNLSDSASLWQEG